MLKRGLVGVYQHVDKKHLDHYLAEFDFRQNTRAKLGIDDVERTRRTISGMVGKRLTYRDSSVSDAREEQPWPRELQLQFAPLARIPTF